MVHTFIMYSYLYSLAIFIKYLMRLFRCCICINSKLSLPVNHKMKYIMYEIHHL